MEDGTGKMGFLFRRYEELLTFVITLSKVIAHSTVSGTFC